MIVAQGRYHLLLGMVVLFCGKPALPFGIVPPAASSRSRLRSFEQSVPIVDLTVDIQGLLTPAKQADEILVNNYELPAYRSLCLSRCNDGNAKRCSIASIDVVGNGVGSFYYYK